MEISGLNKNDMAAAINNNDKDKKLKQACNDFESIFLAQMLKTMRKTVPENALTGSSNERDIYEAMFDEQMASHIANGNQKIGISEALYQSLSKKMNGGS